MRKFRKFLKELVRNVNTFEKYETYEIVPFSIRDALGEESVLEDYGFFEESGNKELKERAEQYRMAFKEVFGEIKKKLKSDKEVFFNAEAVRTFDDKEGVLFEIDVYDKEMRGVYRYFVEEKNLRKLQFDKRNKSGEDTAGGNLYVIIKVEVFIDRPEIVFVSTSKAKIDIKLEELKNENGKECISNYVKGDCLILKDGTAYYIEKAGEIV